MQSLTHLQLHGFLSGPRNFISGTAFSTLQKINLSHLTCLQVQALPSTVIAFLFCVIIPLRTEVILDCEPGFSPDDCTLFPSALAQRYNLSEDQKSPSPVICSLVIAFRDRRANLTLCVGLRSRFPRIRHKAGLQHSPRYLCLVGQIKAGERSGIHEQHLLLRAIDKCRESLRHWAPSLRDLWRKMPGHLQDIRYIKLRQGDMPDLASVLSLRPRGLRKSC